VRIQSESAVRELGLLTYSFASSFETLDVVYVRVRKPDGSVVETPSSAGEPKSADLYIRVDALLTWKFASTTKR
jgi:uncharacterized protein DUF3857